MPTLAEQVAALEAERDCLKANQGVDPEYKVNYERLAAKYDAALRRAVDAESRLASARVEGAREALARFLKERREGTASDDQWDMLCDLERFRDREYPAPAAPAGEQTQHVGGKAKRGDWYTCGKCREDGMHFDGCALGECEAVCVRPAPTPEPEPLVIPLVNGPVLMLTPEDCRRIVALGSRPTQTAEG